jgi:hypothetical protein
LCGTVSELAYREAVFSLGKKKKTTIRVTGHGGLYVCETSRLPLLLDSRLTDGGEVVSFPPWPLLTPRKIDSVVEALCYKSEGRGFNSR